MKKSLLFILFMLMIKLSIGQDDPFGRLKTAANREGMERSQLSPVKITRENPKWKAETKAAIPFVPFELKDKEGRPVPPDRMVDLPSGQKITAQEYINRLNEIEKKLTEQGYTLRTQQPVVVSKTVTRPEFLSGKVANFPRAIAPLRTGKDLENFMSPEKRVGGVVLKPMNKYTTAEKEEVNKYDFNPDNNGGIIAKKNIKARRFPFRPGEVTAIGNPSPLKTIDITNSKKWDLGDAETFQAGIEGNLHRYAKIYPFDPTKPEKSMSEFKVSATGRAWGSLFSHSIDLLNGTAEFNAPADTSKKMSVKFQIKAVGITIFNLSKEYAQSITFNDVKGKTFDKSFPIEVPIGFGFNFKGKIGIKGEAGFEYSGTLFRTFASVQGAPVINLEGYAEAGLDFLGVIGGGVGGKLTFIKGTIPLQAFAGIWSQNAEQVVLAVSYYFGYDLDILSGSLYCYVEACLPWVGCYRPVEHEFYSWTGFKNTGTIAEGTESYVLANVWKREQPVLLSQ